MILLWDFTLNWSFVHGTSALSTLIPNIDLGLIKMLSPSLWYIKGVLYLGVVLPLYESEGCSKGSCGYIWFSLPSSKINLLLPCILAICFCSWPINKPLSQGMSKSFFLALNVFEHEMQWLEEQRLRQFERSESLRIQKHRLKAWKEILKYWIYTFCARRLDERSFQIQEKIICNLVVLNVWDSSWINQPRDGKDDLINEMFGCI